MSRHHPACVAGGQADGAACLVDGVSEAVSALLEDMARRPGALRNCVARVVRALRERLADAAEPSAILAARRAGGKEARSRPKNDRSWVSFNFRFGRRAGFQWRPL